MPSIGPKPFRPSPTIPSNLLRPQPGPVQLPPQQSRAAIDCFEPPARTAPSTARKPAPEPPKPPTQERTEASLKTVKGPAPTDPYATQGKPGMPPVTTTPPTSGRR